jgi:hypothetical protein
MERRLAICLVDWRRLHFLTPKKEQVLNNYCIFAPIKHSNL